MRSNLDNSSNKKTVVVLGETHDDPCSSEISVELLPYLEENNFSFGSETPYVLKKTKPDSIPDLSRLSIITESDCDSATISESASADTSDITKLLDRIAKSNVPFILLEASEDQKLLRISQRAYFDIYSAMEKYANSYLPASTYSWNGLNFRLLNLANKMLEKHYIYNILQTRDILMADVISNLTSDSFNLVGAAHVNGIASKLEENKNTRIVTVYVNQKDKVYNYIQAPTALYVDCKVSAKEAASQIINKIQEEKLIEIYKPQLNEAAEQFIKELLLNLLCNEVSEKINDIPSEKISPDVIRTLINNEFIKKMHEEFNKNESGELFQLVKTFVAIKIGTNLSKEDLNILTKGTISLICKKSAVELENKFINTKTAEVCSGTQCVTQAISDLFRNILSKEILMVLGLLNTILSLSDGNSKALPSPSQNGENNSISTGEIVAFASCALTTILLIGMLGYGVYRCGADKQAERAR